MTPPKECKTIECFICNHRIYDIPEDQLHDQDLRDMIRDSVELEEESLISRKEVDYYLKIHGRAGLEDLVALTGLNFAGCKMRHPLFTNDLKRDIIIFQQHAEKGRDVDFDHGLKDRPANEVIGIPDRLGLRSKELSEEMFTFVVHDDHESANHAFMPLTAARWKSGGKEIDFDSLFDPEQFLPGNPSAKSKEFLKTATTALVREAFVSAFKPEGEKVIYFSSKFLDGLAAKYRPFTIKIGSNYGGSVTPLVIEVDMAGSGKDKKQLTADLKNIIAEIRERFEAELNRLLSDRDLVRGLFDTASLTHELPNEERQIFGEDKAPTPIPFEDPSELLVTHVDQIRDALETEERKRQFIASLKELVRSYQKKDPDLADIKLGLIKSEDMAIGYSAVYHPNNATIYISMSAGGSGSLREVDDVLETLAAALALHKATRIAARGGKKIRQGSPEFAALETKINEELKTKNAQIAATDKNLDLKNILPTVNSSPGNVSSVNVDLNEGLKEISTNEVKPLKN